MRPSRVTVLAVLLVAFVAVGACSTSDPITVAADTVVIDVRTPAEYAEGHLDGAVNLDVQSGSFADDISALPSDADIIVYCRSGNRSAQATQIMEDAGFTAVTDAGAMSDASEATGLAVVTD